MSRNTRAIKKHITQAAKHAVKGNRRDFERLPQEEKGHARPAGPLDDAIDRLVLSIRNWLNDKRLDMVDAFDSRAQITRKSLTDERQYHARLVEKHFFFAAEAAKEGNRRMLEYNLREAQEHARPAGLLGDPFDSRAQIIRNSLTDERQYHARLVEKHFFFASEAAKEGNRRMLEYNLKEAKEHAGPAGLFDEAHRRRVQTILDSLTPVSRSQN